MHLLEIVVEHCRCAGHLLEMSHGDLRLECKGRTSGVTDVGSRHIVVRFEFRQRNCGLEGVPDLPPVPATISVVGVEMLFCVLDDPVLVDFVFFIACSESGHVDFPYADCGSAV